MIGQRPELDSPIIKDSTGLASIVYICFLKLFWWTFCDLVFSNRMVNWWIVFQFIVLPGSSSIWTCAHISMKVELASCTSSFQSGIMGWKRIRIFPMAWRVHAIKPVHLQIFSVTMKIIWGISLFYFLFSTFWYFFILPFTWFSWIGRGANLLCTWVPSC